MILSDGNTIATTGTPEKEANPLRRRLSPLFGITALEMYQRGCHRNSAQTLKSKLDHSRPQCNRPMFSVIMTIKDFRADFLTEALYSLECQTYDDFELIVVSPSIFAVRFVESFCYTNVIRVTAVTTKQGESRTERFHTAVGLATGLYCVVLDSDDLFHPDALWVLLKCLDRFPCVNWFSGSHIEFVHMTDQQVIRKAEPIAQMLASLAVTFRQRHLWGWKHQRGSFPQGIFSGEEWVEDYEIFVHLAMSGVPVLPIPHVLYAWRQHPEQWTRKNSKECQEMCDRVRERCRRFLNTSTPYWSVGDMALAARMTRAMVMLESDILTYPMP